MRRLAWYLSLAGIALGFVAVQSWAVQVFHDSCRMWSEPPPWASFCPPSTRHGRPYA